MTRVERFNSPLYRFNFSLPSFLSKKEKKKLNESLKLSFEIQSSLSLSLSPLLSRWRNIDATEECKKFSGDINHVRARCYREIERGPGKSFGVYPSAVCLNSDGWLEIHPIMSVYYFSQENFAASPVTATSHAILVA